MRGTVTRINSTGKITTTATPTSATDVTNTYVDIANHYTTTYLYQLIEQLQ
jgi:hypothetical protein